MILKLKNEGVNTCFYKYLATCVHGLIDLVSNLWSLFLDLKEKNNNLNLYMFSNMRERIYMQ